MRSSMRPLLGLGMLALAAAGSLAGTPVHAHGPGSPSCIVPPWSPAEGARHAARLPTLATGLGRAPASTTGNVHLLVLLVEFSDLPARVPASRFPAHLFGPGFTMTDYFAEISRGQLSVTGDVYGWLTLPETEFFYSQGAGGIGAYPNNGQRMTEDAVAAAVASGIDLGDYDADGDGVVDALLVIHSGQGFEWAASGAVTPEPDPDAINSHRWVVVDGEFGSGANVVDYFTCPELQLVRPVQLPSWPDSIATIGVYCHEFGHILGLPDFYDTQTFANRVGQWDLMDYGTWNRDPLTPELSAPGALPGGLSAWSRGFLGWETAEQIAPAAGEELTRTVTLTSASDGSGTSLQLLPNPNGIDWVGTRAGTGEYFLAEVRTRTGYDFGLPDEGLLLYHVDESHLTNRASESPFGGGLLVLVARDGDTSITTDSSDVWPGTPPQSTFGPASVPSSDFFDGSVSGVTLSDLGGFDGTSISLTANVENLSPTLSVPFARPQPWRPSLHGSVDLVFGFDPVAGSTEVTVYDLLGRRVRRLTDPGDFSAPGRVASWDGRDDSGRPLPSGVYFFRGEGAATGSGRVVLLR